MKRLKVGSPKKHTEEKCQNLQWFQDITYHLIFDVKMGFTRKAGFISNGSTTDTPCVLCYSSVVLRDSIGIAFLIAALNCPDVFAYDIRNNFFLKLG